MERLENKLADYISESLKRDEGLQLAIDLMRNGKILLTYAFKMILTIEYHFTLPENMNRTKSWKHTQQAQTNETTNIIRPAP